MLQFLRPDVYLVVLDPSTADFKPSSRLYLDRADAFLLSGDGKAAWDGVAPRLLRGRPMFPLEAGFRLGEDVIAFVESHRKVRVAGSR